MFPVPRLAMAVRVVPGRGRHPREWQAGLSRPKRARSPVRLEMTRRKTEKAVPQVTGARKWRRQAARLRAAGAARRGHRRHAHLAAPKFPCRGRHHRRPATAGPRPPGSPGRSPQPAACPSRLSRVSPGHVESERGTAPVRARGARRPRLRPVTCPGPVSSPIPAPRHDRSESGLRRDNSKKWNVGRARPPPGGGRLREAAAPGRPLSPPGAGGSAGRGRGTRR